MPAESARGLIPSGWNDGIGPPSLTTLIVIPTYNECGNIARLAAQLIANPDYSLLIVDDNSPDGTGPVVDRLVDRYGHRIQALHRPRKLGLGSAYVDGFRVALQ